MVSENSFFLSYILGSTAGLETRKAAWRAEKLQGWTQRDMMVDDLHGPICLTK